jgi:hypothetical protein
MDGVYNERQQGVRQMGLGTSRKARPKRLEWKRRLASRLSRSNEDRAAQTGQVRSTGPGAGLLLW